MKSRCNNPNHHAYHNYGGRGIRICPEWLHSFETFLQDMGERPDGLTLDRSIMILTTARQIANGLPNPSNVKTSDPNTNGPLKKHQMPVHDLYYLSIAQAVASKSKDPSTKTGAVIVAPDGRIVSTGYNGFPRGMPDSPSLYADRDAKYSRIIHCEMNAVLFARECLTGCSLYTWPFLSCDRCAVHMLQAGISEFIAPVCSPDLAARWASSFVLTRKYAVECGAEVREMVL
jgi:dCMP deaminase